MGCDIKASYIFSCSSVSKKISLHKMQNGSLQQKFCACCNQNVKQVILMPTDLYFVWLYMYTELNLYFVTIVFFLHIFRCNHELYNE